MANSEPQVQDATVTPLKDPKERNEAALEGLFGIQADLEREMSTRKGLESELQRERTRRIELEDDLRRATQMIDSLNERARRAGRRKISFRGRR
jgi:hypothetical protein